MPTKFLSIDDPGALTDHVRYPHGEPKKDQVECPKCRGYGGHVLELNAYPLPKDVDDTRENRMKYVHFRSSCSQCNGWGYVGPEDASCIHEMGNRRNIGNCLNEYTCLKCGRKYIVDSSD